MAFSNDDAMGPFPGFSFGDGHSYTGGARRVFVWNGSREPAVPGGGARISGVSGPTAKTGYLATPGALLKATIAVPAFTTVSNGQALYSSGTAGKLDTTTGGTQVAICRQGHSTGASAEDVVLWIEII